MSSLYQQDLFALLPDDLPKPTEQHLALLQEVDESVQDGYDSMNWQIARSRVVIRNLLHPGSFKRNIFQSVPRPGFVKRNDPDHPTTVSEEIIAEHQRRVTLVRSLFTHESFQHCTMEDGGTKSRKRVEEKLAVKTTPERPHPAIIDMSRMRVVVPELSMMSRTIVRMAEALYWDRSQLRVVEILDWFYSDHEITKYATPLRCANVVFQPLMPHDTATTLLTEIQFVTRRMRAAMDLNHPFDATKRLAYPSEEHAAWMRMVMMKAALLDYRNQIHALGQ